MQLAIYRQELNKLTEYYLSILSLISEKEWNFKPSEKKWSKKEILGHLIDSSHINYDRFIRIQLEENPSILYQQDEWVEIQGYQTQPHRELILTWERMNKRISCLLTNLPTENLGRTAQFPDKKHTLAEILEDYLQHTRHHLNQISGK